MAATTVKIRGLLLLLFLATAGSVSDRDVRIGDRESQSAHRRLSSNSLALALDGELECACREHQDNTKTQASDINVTNKDGKSARIFYQVSIHNQRTLDDAVPLLRAIRDPRNIVLIHLDVKFGLENYEDSLLQQEIEGCPCGCLIEVASVHNATWSSWSMNLPTFWGLEKAVNEHWGKWDVWINLSGDSLPVYTADRISKLFGGPLAGINFVTSIVCETGLTPTPIDFFPQQWHKRGHYSHQPARLDYTDDNGVRHTNVTLTVYFGSQWMSLQPDWCKFIVEQMSRPDSLPSQFRDYLIQTKKLMSDETFMTTMIMHYCPETTPKIHEDGRLMVDNVTMYSIRYERMDEHVPTSRGWYTTEQRYEVPEDTGIGQPKPWGPYYLGVYDLNNIRESGALYIRKVATSLDPNMYRILPVDHPSSIPPILWPLDVKVSPVPTDWNKKIREMKKPEAAVSHENGNSDILNDEAGGDDAEEESEDGEEPETDEETSEEEESSSSEEPSSEEPSEEGEEGSDGEEKEEAEEDDDTGSFVPKEFRPNYDDAVLADVLAST
eukprot:Nitzschia sp. Nitz4//scaffold438_size7339//211//1869//NITZ4_009158-RA/size7339-processed-gene-0.0-mRNA-1//1//CDS//3329551856//9166//frame0